MKVAASPRIYMGRCPKAVFKSLVIGDWDSPASSSRAQPSLFTALQEISVYALGKNDVLVLSHIRQ